MAGPHEVVIPWTILVDDAMEEPPDMFPELSQVDETVPKVWAEREVPPTIPIALEPLESTVTPQLGALILDPLLILRSSPEVPSRQMRVGLDWPSSAVAVAETVRVFVPGLKTWRKIVGIGLETTACTQAEGAAPPPLFE